MPINQQKNFGSPQAWEVLQKVVPAFYEDNGDHPDVVVVDPPRKGCDQVCLDTIIGAAPERVVYVSCDPATLARDVRILCDAGYELKKYAVFDMFPNSYHVEVCCLLERLRSAKDHIVISIDADDYYRIKDNK